MAEIIRITKAEFERFRPINGFLLLEGIQDTSVIEIGGVPMFFDGSYNPENSQKVINRVIAIPEEDTFHAEGFSSDILVAVGDVVWVNYYNVIQGVVVEVFDPEKPLEIKPYVLVSYRDCFMSLYQEEDETPTYNMLNDYILLKAEVQIDNNPLLPDPAKRKESRLYYTVERTPIYGTFVYEKDKYPYITVEEGNKVFMLDRNQFKLEHFPHYVYDKEPHFVTRVHKVVAVVDSIDSEAEVF